ncbi:unnamed protein product [Rotaria sp. Silwood2]|nr:unnamed protein product [Rotaria sp. Silwood2]
MQNLSHLTILTARSYINGYKWEQWITDYLPKLKIFQTIMLFAISENSRAEEKVDEILDSFRTHFWIHKHQCLQLRTDRNPLSLFDEFTSKSIRQLDLHSPHACWNEQYCTTFSHTSLGLQCEVLTIAVENRTAILCLVNSMKNLRALTVFSRDDPWKMKLDYEQFPLEEDMHIKWLQRQLPSTCTISRVKSLPNKIRLWIQ